MTGDEPPNPTVVDTTALSNFAYLGRMDLLVDLPRLGTVPVVREELSDGEDSYPYLNRALSVIEDTIALLEPTDEERSLEQSLLEEIDPGEAQALAVVDLRDGTLVTDDGDARSIAQRRDLSLTGSIGVLMRGVEHDLADHDTADSLLKQLIDETGFRAPSRHLDDYR